MFLFIGGVQPKTVHVEGQARFCQSCGQMTLILKRIDHYLSLFFIPLFPVKRGAPFLACERCGASFKEGGPHWEGKRAEKKRKCCFCGRDLDSDFVYCPYCGRGQ